MGRGGRSWFRTHKQKKALEEIRKQRAAASESGNALIQEPRMIHPDHDEEEDLERSNLTTTTTTTTTTTANQDAAAQDATLAAGVMNNDTDDQTKMELIASQANRAAKQRVLRGSGAVIAGGLGLGIGIAAATGPLAPATLAALAVASGAFAAFKYGINKWRRNKMVEDVLKEEFGIDWKNEMKAVRKMVERENPNMGLRDKEVREIILRAHGAEGTTRTDAYKAVNRKRAHFLMEQLHNPQYHDVALGLIEALGVHKRGESFAKGAEELLAEKLSK